MRWVAIRKLKKHVNSSLVRFLFDIGGNPTWSGMTLSILAFHQDDYSGFFIIFFSADPPIHRADSCSLVLLSHASSCFLLRRTGKSTIPYWVVHWRVRGGPPSRTGRSNFAYGEVHTLRVIFTSVVRAGPSCKYEGVGITFPQYPRLLVFRSKGEKVLRHGPIYSPQSLRRTHSSKHAAVQTLLCERKIVSCRGSIPAASRGGLHRSE